MLRVLRPQTTIADDDEYTTVIKVRLVKFCKFQVNLFSG
jgi:hypothetical protein